MELTIVYEDDALLVVDKPAGLVVHPGAGTPDHTLVNALLAYCGDSLSGIGGVRRPGIVHRLDKDTSGLLVVAKTDRAHVGLCAQFADRSLSRTYAALVWGVPRLAEGEIAGAIGRDPRDRKRMAVVRHGGKPALTFYRVEQRFGTLASLIHCRLATGRTHQIRVHLTALGHPLVGDPVYGRRRPATPTPLQPTPAGAIPLAPAGAIPPAPAGAIQGTGGPLPNPREVLATFPRQALHAIALTFLHPCTGAQLTFHSPIPSDMHALLGCLGA